MRRSVAQAGCLALPFMTAIVGSVVTPGYPLAGHATTLSIATITAFGALFAITLNMRNDPGTEPGWPIAAGWVLATSILIVTLMETVILHPRGIAGRHWLPSMGLLVIAIVALCERDGRPVDRGMLQRASAHAMLALGATLAVSLLLSATASRMSGDDFATISVVLLFALPVLGGAIQTMRGDAARGRLGTAALLMLLLIIVTAEGTYTWTPHYNDDSAGRTVFQ